MFTVLRKLREESGAGQAAFAEKSGMSPSLVSMIEGGQRLMSEEAATKAAAVLGENRIDLLVTHNMHVLKQGGPRGRDGLVNAQDLARQLDALMSAGNLSVEQRRQARQVIEELVEMVEGVAAATKDLDAHHPDDSHLGTMRGTGRDGFGRKIPASLKSSEADRAEKSSDTEMGALGRDSFGRRL